MVATIVKAYQREEFAGALALLPATDSGVDEWQLHILLSIEPGEQVKILKHEANFGVA